MLKNYLIEFKNLSIQIQIILDLQTDHETKLSRHEWNVKCEHEINLNLPTKHFTTILSTTIEPPVSDHPKCVDCSLTIIGWFSNRTESQLTTARANQTTGLTNGRAANWAPEVVSFPRAFPSATDVPVLLLNQPNLTTGGLLREGLLQEEAQSHLLTQILKSDFL